MSYCIDNRLRLGILACFGGFAVGFAAKAAVNSFTRKKCDVAQIDEREYGQILFNESEFKRNDVTAFSDITELVGSVSEHHIADESTREYHYFETMQNYPNTAKNRTLMAKYLTPEIYETFWNVQTPLGFTFDNMIQSGLDVSQFPNCGFIAGDEETYDEFADFIDPILTEKHNGFRRGINKHPKCLDPGKLSGKCALLDSNYVASVSLTVGRSVSGYRFLPTCNRAERRDIEEKFRNIFQSLSTAGGMNFEGEYFPLENTTREILRMLPRDSPYHWTEKPTAPVYLSAGITRDWPDARGIFVCRNQGIFASVNRDDHLRLFIKENHADVARVFNKFCKLHEELERKMADEGLKFAYHSDYGYLLWYPSVIGTGLKICISVQLRHLTQSSRLFEVMKRLRLRFNFSQESEKAQNGWVEVYNGDRLGISEVELTELVTAGVQRLIDLEKELEKSRSIDDMIPVQKGAHFDYSYAE